MNATTESVNVSLPQEEDLQLTDLNMSLPPEEDLELTDLVTEALEKNGALAKLRAQLRANIFLILDDEHSSKHYNPRLQEVLSTQDGILTLLLVQELFEFCDLKQSKSIFNAETGGNKTYIYENRSHVSQYFSFAKLHFDDRMPLLVHLIKLSLKLLRREEDADSEKEKSLNESETSQKTTGNNTFVVNSGRSDNYDLSFTSESSTATEDRNKLIFDLNLNNDTSETEKSSTVIIKPSSETTSISVSPSSEVIDEIIKSDNEKTRRALNESKSDDSIPEEIIEVKSVIENNGHVTDDESLPLDIRYDSPPPNILDTSIPETPSTKIKVKEQINHLIRPNANPERLLKLADQVENGATEKTKMFSMNGIRH